MMETKDTTEVVAIAERIRAARKYRAVFLPTVERAVREALRRFGPVRAEEEARNLLHQVWGAYWGSRPDFAKILSRLADDRAAGKTPKEAALTALRLHSSTAEREPILDRFYREIFAVTGTPRTIVDHACGLNPLTIPWMELPADASYRAYDIDEEEIDFLNSAAKVLGFADVLHAEAGDVLADTFPPADVVFLLKLLPCLEHQEKGAARTMLRRAAGKHVVASYPTASIGGKGKGMPEFYEQQFSAIARAEGLRYKTLAFPTELVFIVRKD